MKKAALFIPVLLLLFTSSCHKCEVCKQYCAYCIPQGNNGIVLKFCATKDISRQQVDSMYFALQAGNYDCSKLDNEKRVCDQSGKLRDAVDYYRLQEYYCYPE